MAHHLHPLITNLPAEACVRKHVLRGNFLFRQQQAATAIFAVESGRLRLFRDLSDGSSVTLHVAREQETFAEASLFSSHYHCHAQAELGLTREAVYRSLARLEGHGCLQRQNGRITLR